MSPLENIINLILSSSSLDQLIASNGLQMISICFGFEYPKNLIFLSFHWLCDGARKRLPIPVHKLIAIFTSTREHVTMPKYLFNEIFTGHRVVVGYDLVVGSQLSNKLHHSFVALPPNLPNWKSTQISTLISLAVKS